MKNSKTKILFSIVMVSLLGPTVAMANETINTLKDTFAETKCKHYLDYFDTSSQFK